jgi:hypothetical protein
VRIAALFCGLVAGLFALLAPTGLGSDLLTPFMKLWGPSTGQQMLGTVAWHAPMFAAILGGLLAFVAPGPGALLLGVSGLAWLGIGVMDATFLRAEVLVPGVASVAGALLAFLAGELELRRRRAARRQRRELMRDGGDRPERSARLPVDEPPEWPERRERSAREERDEAAAREREEARAREAAFKIDPLTVPREEAPLRPSREIPLTLEDVVPQEAPEPPRRRQAETIWPDAPAGRRSMFDRDSGSDLQPRRSLFERPATRVDRVERAERTPRRDREPERNREPERDRDYRDSGRDSVRERVRGRDRDRDRETYYDDEPAPRRNMIVWIAAANGLVLVVLGLVVAYMMVDRSPAPVTSAVAEATDDTATSAVPEAPAEAPAVPAGDTERLEANVWPALALPGTEIPELPMAPDGSVAAPAEVAIAPAAGGYADPFAYCGAVQTVDYVDNRYTGPRFTAEIAEALRVPMGSAPDRVSWRCVEGIVYACASFDWPVCAMTPTAQEMVEYCLRNPGVTRLLAPNGTWSCEGNKPRLPDGASWPVDARGFFPNAWIPVLPPQRPTG